MRNSCLSLRAKPAALQKIAARLLCSAALTLFVPVAANANPQNGKVAAGSATISQSDASTLNINQQSQKAIINWQSFSIATGQTTNFIQPDASAITLNRVTGVDPSSIKGNLNANGQVWLINPNGIAFGKSARVDVAGLLATTIDIADQDFLGGNYKFTGLANPGAMVTNAGKITVRDAGLAALVAPGVANSGVIEADLGQIQLSSAAAFTIDFYGDGLFNFTLDKQVTQAIKNANGTQPTAAVTNTGKLIADGGTIALTANVASSVVSNSINMSGYAQATSAKVSNGQIVLDGGDDGTVEVTGNLNASGTQSGQTGGTVEVTGNTVNVASTAKINATGDVGGGTVLIGGDMHGGGSLRQASNTAVASGATVKADAISTGNGGTVVVWSKDQTNFDGAISSKGGTQGGNGGSSEVSSQGLLGFNGTVDLTAAFGSVGSLLLDPEDVTIAASGTEPRLPSSAPGGIELDPASTSSVLSVSTLESALVLADVTVTTGTTGSQPGDITVAADIDWSGAHSLTLDASRNIVIDPDITIANTGAGNLALHAGYSGSGSGTVTFGTGSKADWSASTGSVSIFYNPADNPADSGINSTSYTNPTDFSSSVVSGQLTSYMLVNSVSDLQDIQNDLSADYALGGNITATATASWNGGEGFIPLGYSAASTTNSEVPSYGPFTGPNATPTAFTGIFDGQGHTISGLVIDNTSAFNLGLFSYIGPTGTVRNVGLVGGSVTSGTGYQNIGQLAAWNLGTIENASSSGSVTAGDNSQHVGGLVGWNYWNGTVNDSESSTSVQAGSSSVEVGGLVGENGYYFGGSTIENSHASGTVMNGSNSSGTGGLVGENEGIVSDSFASGTVTGGVNANAIGGLVGGNNGYWSGGYVLSSYATGSVTGDNNSELVGGLVGVNSWDATVENSYATGNVSGGSAVGGLVGWNGYTPQGIPAFIDTSYSVGSVSGSSLVGGLVGENYAGSATNSYWDTDTSGVATSAIGIPINTLSLKTLPTQFDSSIWTISSNVNSGYPYLKWQTASTSAPAPTKISFGTFVNQNSAIGTALAQLESLAKTATGYRNDVLVDAESAYSTASDAVSNTLKNFFDTSSAASNNQAQTTGSERVIFASPTPPTYTFSQDGSEIISPTAVYVTMGEVQVPVYPQKEDLQPYDMAHASTTYGLDCIATVYAMIGSIEQTLDSGKQTTLSAKTYTDPSQDYGATSSPLTKNAGPTINLVGVTSPSGAPPFTTPNPLVKNYPIQSYSDNTGLAIIAGTLPSSNPSPTIQHVMLAIGTTKISIGKQSYTYVEALDPETGKEVAIDQATGVVSYYVVTSPNGYPTYEPIPSDSQIAKFSIWGFAAVKSGS